MTEELNSVSPVLKADWFDSRWGKEDQRRNGNLMTREKVLEAVKRRCYGRPPGDGASDILGQQAALTFLERRPVDDRDAGAGVGRCDLPCDVGKQSAH